MATRPPISPQIQSALQIATELDRNQIEDLRTFLNNPRGHIVHTTDLGLIAALKGLKPDQQAELSYRLGLYLSRTAVAPESVPVTIPFYKEKAWRERAGWHLRLAAGVAIVLFYIFLAASAEERIQISERELHDLHNQAH